MPNCTRVKPKPYKICTGDFRYQITIKSRTKSAQNSSLVEPNLTLADVATLWAMQKSVNGEEIFNGTDIVGKITDEFYIRYNTAITVNKTNIISSSGSLYNIEDIIWDYQGRRQLTVFRCSKRGDQTLSVNKLANV